MMRTSSFADRLAPASVTILAGFPIHQGITFEFVRNADFEDVCWYLEGTTEIPTEIPADSLVVTG